MALKGLVYPNLKSYLYQRSKKSRLSLRIFPINFLSKFGRPLERYVMQLREVLEKIPSALQLKR